MVMAENVLEYSMTWCGGTMEPSEMIWISNGSAIL